LSCFGWAQNPSSVKAYRLAEIDLNQEEAEMEEDAKHRDHLDCPSPGPLGDESKIGDQETKLEAKNS
jgi:hypothetical protein